MVQLRWFTMLYFCIGIFFANSFLWAQDWDHRAEGLIDRAEGTIKIRDTIKQAFKTLYNDSSSVRFIPFKTKTQGQLFFADDNISSLDDIVISSVFVSGEAKSGSVSADFYHTFIGFSRMTFGGLISKASSLTDSTQSLENFLARGGNGYLEWDIPFISINEWDDDYRLLFFIRPRLAANIPGLGSSTDKIDANWDLACELRGFLGSQKEDLYIFGYLRMGLVGGSDIFFESIKAPSTANVGVGQVTIGLRLAQFFNIAYQGLFAYQPWMRDRITSRLTVQLIPKR